MFIVEIVSIFLIMVLLMLMLAQARPWIKAKVPGKVWKTVPLGFWQRISYHRSTLLALATGLLLCRAAGWLPDSLALFAACFALAILCLPMHYTFTSQGVAIGRAIFRPWDEFGSVEKQPSRVILQNRTSPGRLTLFVKTAELDGMPLPVKNS
jgi:hypothetical protein